MLAPVPINVPPQLPLYHLQLAPVPKEPPVTVNVPDPPGQKLLLLVVMLVGSVDCVFTVTVTDAAVVLLQSPSKRT